MLGGGGGGGRVNISRILGIARGGVFLVDLGNKHWENPGSRDCQRWLNRV